MIRLCGGVIHSPITKELLGSVKFAISRRRLKLKAHAEQEDREKKLVRREMQLKRKLN